jgi:hypothetical protein
VTVFVGRRSVYETGTPHDVEPELQSFTVSLRESPPASPAEVSVVAFGFI